MKRSLVIVLLAALLLTGTTSVWAGNSSKKGTAGAQELLIPVGAQGTAMGGANLADVKGIEAIYWNPAGLAITSVSTEAVFSHTNYIAGMAIDYGAAAVNFEGFGTLALSIKSLNFGDIPVTTEDFPEGTGDMFSPSYTTLGLSYAQVVTDRIAVGATVKIVNESIVRTSATGFAFDAGVQYAFDHTSSLHGVKFAVVLKNLGPMMQYDGPDLERTVSVPNSAPNAQDHPLRFTSQAFELPSTLEIGTSYDYMLTESNRISVMGMFVNNNFGDDEVRFGGEYGFNDLFHLRAGYQMSNQGDAAIKSIYNMSFGAGVNIDLGSLKMGVDYAYRNTDIFKGINTLAVTIGL